MWKITKEEQLNGPIGYLHLTRLDDEGEELSEKLMLPVVLNPGSNWNETPGSMTDDQVARLLHGIIETLQLFEDELTDEDEDDYYLDGGIPEENICYVKTHVVPASQ
jgi:hypothetical protein